MNAYSPALVSAAPQSPRGYRQAHRHSGRVRLLKIAIPTGVVLACAAVAGVAFFNPFAKVGLTLGPVSMSGSKIAMQAPRLTGFKKDDRPYEVTAIAAYQDIRKPNVIELKDMKAKMAVDKSGAAAHLVSSTGLFDTQKELLELTDNIRITTDKGEEALLRSASVDFKANTVISKEPVSIITPQGRIDATGVHVTEGGKTISFSGRVHATFQRASGTKGAGPDLSGAKLTQAEPVGDNR